MKHEISKKSLLYGILAYLISILVGMFTPMPIAVSVIFVTISELVSLGWYYSYEIMWQRRKRLKKGMLLISKDKNSWYNVVEVLDDNKIIIEVV